MGYADQKLKGIVSIIAGLSIWGIGIPLAITWIIFCFGSIIIGILLLTFSPAMLFGPLFMSGAFGLTFITTGTERFCQGKNFG